MVLFLEHEECKRISVVRARSMWLSVVIVVETETEGFKHGREVNTSKLYAR